MNKLSSVNIVLLLCAHDAMHSFITTGIIKAMVLYYPMRFFAANQKE